MLPGVVVRTCKRRLGRWRQGSRESEASLGYMANICWGAMKRTIVGLLDCYPLCLEWTFFPSWEGVVGSAVE